MAIINIHTFSGDGTSGNEYVNVLFDIDNDILSAKTSAGAFPDIQYSNYVPDLPEGDIINTFNNNNFQYIFRWNLLYPFATFSKISLLPPVETLTVSATKTDETSPNQMDGTATITATGGTGVYEYSLNNVDWQSSNIFTGLSFGSYIAYVRDNGTGLGQTTFTIAQGQYPPAPPIVPVIPDITCLSGGELPREGGFKRAIVKTVFGTTPSTLYNGDFEQYDGQNWSQWTKYGGINVSRGQRTVLNGNGNPIPISNYTLVFNEKANAGKYIEHSVLPVQQGATGKFSINIGKTEGTSFNVPGFVQVGNFQVPGMFYTSYELRIRIKVGNFYLYNVNGGNSFEWVNQLAVVTRDIYNNDGDINSFIMSINIPAIPVSGSIVIDLFGFMKTQTVFTNEYKPNAFITFPPITNRIDLPEYSPVEVDDVKLEISNSSNDTGINGVVSISDNLDYYTEKLDQIDIIAGDLYFGDVGKNEFETLYAIYDQEGNPTTGWIDLGITTSPIPFGAALAQSVMQSYQAAYDEFTGELLLKDGADRFSYLDTYSFNVMLKNVPLPAIDFNSKQFVLLGGNINLKTNIMSNIRMREFFRRLARTSDITIPVNDDTPLPPITNDPNNTELINIFTEEFTEEFI